MSAFIVNNRTINAILQGKNFGAYPGNALRYMWRGEGRSIEGSVQKVGQVLVDENFRSVNFRYNEDQKPYAFRIIQDKSYTPVEVISMCDCYNYQSCEAPLWKETEAYAIVNALRERAIRNLPGYAEAYWRLEE
jgi:hypothetical protein